MEQWEKDYLEIVEEDKKYKGWKKIFRRRRKSGFKLYKESFFKNLFQLCGYLLLLFIIYVMLLFLCGPNSEAAAIATFGWLLGSVALILYFICFILKCLVKGKLKL